MNIFEIFMVKKDDVEDICHFKTPPIDLGVSELGTFYISIVINDTLRLCLA